MKIYASVFIYKRPKTLRHCLRTIFANSVQPDEIDLIDDASGPETEAVIREEVAARENKSCKVNVITKPVNLGATDSGQYALKRARELNPDFWFPIEGDYIFQPSAFRTVLDVYENTPEGALAAGIVGYDHPLFYTPWATDSGHGVFAKAMKQQVGADNVNRAKLWQPWETGRGYALEKVSNTCPTSYLNWQAIIAISAEFPELQTLLDEAMNPQENPDYPDSAKYKRDRQIDDGMLSHAINLCWNYYAIAHKLDRSRFAAWLNIKPSVANNITGGGINSQLAEMSTDGGSPSWRT